MARNDRKASSRIVALVADRSAAAGGDAAIFGVLRCKWQVACESVGHWWAWGAATLTSLGSGEGTEGYGAQLLVGAREADGVVAHMWRTSSHLHGEGAGRHFHRSPRWMSVALPSRVLFPPR